jgi:hypothetical protein
MCRSLRLLSRKQALVFALLWPFIVMWSVELEGMPAWRRIGLFGPVPESDLWILWLVIVVPPVIFLLAWTAAHRRWRR